VVEGMASVGATNTEIADVLGVDEGTIRKRFPETLDKARAGLKVRLRRKQIELALEGNPTMLVWLGKQILKQTERVDTTSGDMPLPTTARVILVRPEDAENG
jgi:transcription initiation factor TFIIIB Brf1 subunit/transcription initiation factor TFIIB